MVVSGVSSVCCVRALFFLCYFLIEIGICGSSCFFMPYTLWVICRRLASFGVRGCFNADYGLFIRPLAPQVLELRGFEAVFSGSGGWDFLVLKAYDQGFRWGFVYTLLPLSD